MSRVCAHPQTISLSLILSSYFKRCVVSAVPKERIAFGKGKDVLLVTVSLVAIYLKLHIVSTSTFSVIFIMPFM